MPAALILFAASLVSVVLLAPAHGQEEVILSIDVDPTDGSGPCLPVTRTVTIERLYRERHAVAICLEGHPYPPSAFDITLLYNNRLNRGVEVPCTGACLDGNPDANDGDGPAFLGFGWTCATDKEGAPTADGDAPGGDAHLVCQVNALFPNAQLSESPGLLAVMDFDVLASGTDRLRFTRIGDAGFRPTTVDRYVCGQSMLCRSGTIHKVAEKPRPTATVAPTFTRRPTATRAVTAAPTPEPPTATPVVLPPERPLLLDEVGLCSDGIDNDGDGMRDCADPDCEEWPGCGGERLLPWWAWLLLVVTAGLALSAVFSRARRR